MKSIAISYCGSSKKSSSSAGSYRPTSTATTTAATPAPASGAASTVTLSAKPGALAFSTTTLTAKAGKVTVDLTNPAGNTIPHAIAVEGNGVDKDGPTVQGGGHSTVTLNLKPGTYSYYCPVPGHKAAGMKGTLTVS